VEDRASPDSLHAQVLRLVEYLTTTREVDRDTGAQTHFNVAGDTERYTTTPSAPDASTVKETVAEA